MRLELLAASDPRVESSWRELEALAHPTYFLTWGWIENWLACLGPERAPQLALITDGDVVAAFFLGRQRKVRHHVLPSRAMFLNSTGIPSFDELCIEHNTILCRPGVAPALTRWLELLPHDWDELFLPAVDRDTVWGLDSSSKYRVHIDREVAAPFVDLARVRSANDYVSLLGSNTRAHIRRAFRAIGACHLEVAQNVEQALEIYQELVALHTASWARRQQPGAFADPWFDHFHRRLIAQRFAHGEIQLLALRAGSTTIGCIYNLVVDGRALFYQSGLGHFVDPRLKAGYLCHSAAIEHCAAMGLATYDLLGGDARYKAALATDTARLAWIRVQRPLLRFSLEHRAKQLRGVVRN